MQQSKMTLFTKKRPQAALLWERMHCCTCRLEGRTILGVAHSVALLVLLCATVAASCMTYSPQGAVAESGGLVVALALAASVLHNGCGGTPPMWGKRPVGTTLHLRQ